MTAADMRVRTRLGRSVPYILSLTIGFTGYKALKQVFFPGLTKWQSHAMSIAVVALLATVCSIWFQRLLSVHATHGVALAERLRQEERFRALIQHAADVISVVDPDGTIRYQSPSVTRLLGYHETALVGSDLFALVHPDDLARMRAAFAARLETRGDGPGSELRVRHRDGSWRAVEASSNNLLANPHIRGIVVTARDITVRQRAEETLRASEAALAEAQRIAQVGNWWRDVDTGAAHWSDEMYRIHGFALGGPTWPGSSWI